MSRHFRSRNSLLSTAFILLLLTFTVTLPPMGQSVDADVQEFLTAWDAAGNAHAADGILRLHAEDCVAVNRFGTSLVGKQATAGQMERLPKEIFKDAHLPPLQLLNLRSVTPDLVILQASCQNPSLHPLPAPQVSGMIVSILRRRNGSGSLAEEREV
ncbi:Cif family virulence factor [Granulicella mallensis]|uniref:DUF4440 domain-containing protein n=1 Tax=Granulicella mallensis (strain ATCC BAA-1857 / DSM 23137 / MP5ACTX8) TaxID=682795 RepID=G8NPS0_GRAMM|nr:nuclear transport factor 2 family protein [Granulicella mallensis]AEU37159.1 hypothetical protein AciX8_2856 [Granulicella mallensis MP5ACTX8]